MFCLFICLCARNSGDFVSFVWHGLEGDDRCVPTRKTEDCSGNEFCVSFAKRFHNSLV